MTIIRQPSLFSIQELYDMAPTQKYDAIVSAMDLDFIYHEVKKKTRRGAPEQLNYPAMIVSFFIRYVERIPTIKDLVKRLQNDLTLKLDCGFLDSDDIPSEASYFCMIKDFKDTNVLESSQERVILQAIKEGFIMDETIAIDATHFEARDQAPANTEKENPTPKKRGRKSKAEQEQWLKEKVEQEANLPLYQKKIAAQLDATLTELRQEISSDGKNVFWYGYKGHLAVSASSQYIIKSLFSSGNLNDGKAAIPLLKGMSERLPLSTVRFQTMDGVMIMSLFINKCTV